MKSDIYENFTILSFDELESTNDKAKIMARNHEAKGGSVITCQLQTQGRGRIDRSWSSSKGDLSFSLILQPKIDINIIHQITILTANVLKDTIARLFSDHGKENKVVISKKWPNDILINDKKVAGILVESEMTNGNCDFIVIGVGVNIVSKPEDVMFEAVSLAQFNIEVVASKLLQQFLSNFTQQYVQWLNYGFAGVRSKWLEDAWRLGESIKINNDNQVTSGIFKDLDDNAQIVLDRESELVKISIGDVS